MAAGALRRLAAVVEMIFFTTIGSVLLRRAWRKEAECIKWNLWVRGSWPICLSSNCLLIMQSSWLSQLQLSSLQCLLMHTSLTCFLVDLQLLLKASGRCASVPSTSFFLGCQVWFSLVPCFHTLWTFFIFSVGFLAADPQHSLVGPSPVPASLNCLQLHLYPSVSPCL